MNKHFQNFSSFNDVKKKECLDNKIFKIYVKCLAVLLCFNSKNEELIYELLLFTEWCAQFF